MQRSNRDSALITVGPLSGQVTEAGRNWPVDDLRRYVDHIIVCCGHHRLMWGSDWSVVDLAGGLGYWRNACVTLPKDYRPTIAMHFSAAHLVISMGYQGLAKSGEITLM
jgi:hypothetical protein